MKLNDFGRRLERVESSMFSPKGPDLLTFPNEAAYVAWLAQHQDQAEYDLPKIYINVRLEDV